MIRPLYLGYIAITITTLTLSTSLVNSGFVWGIGVAVFVGIFWVISAWRYWRVGSILSLFFIVLGISVVATQNENVRVSLLISTVATLIAWDLSAFDRLLSANKQIISENELIRNHLTRLVSVLILSSVLPLFSFALHFDLQFWQAFLLGVILLAGLSQVFTQLKRSNS